MDAPTVTIGDRSATLEVCDVLDALDFNLDDESKLGRTPSARVAMGAGLLAVCWPADVAWPARKRPRPWAIEQGKVTALEYGRAVVKNLTEAGLDFAEVAEATRQARNWAPVSALPTQAEVEAAQDFSEAPAAPGA